MLQGPELVALHVVKELLVVQAEDFGLALKQFNITLVVDVETVLGEGPDLLFHDQGLLAIHTERRDNAYGIGQRVEVNWF